MSNHNDISDDEDDSAEGFYFKKIEHSKITETKSDLAEQLRITKQLTGLLCSDLKKGYSFGKNEFIIASYLLRHYIKIKRANGSSSKYYKSLVCLADKIRVCYELNDKAINSDHISTYLKNLEKLSLIQYSSKEYPTNKNLDDTTGAKVRLTFDIFHQNKNKYLK